MQQDHSEVKEIKFSNAELLPEVVRLMDEGHTVTINLRGFSMRPFLENDRDKALLTKAKEIHKGDVVLAETAPKHYVLHRIINIDGDHITLRGDGNLLEEHCRREDVKGFAIGFYAKGERQSTRPTASSGYFIPGYGRPFTPSGATSWQLTGIFGSDFSNPFKI